ncbi:hypothetical protein ACFV6E_14405 [Streptomyces sp. NPDC059785]|uniref:hypothetical protein n=1 Tax=Streptomyces sp. NPDC059785 TaxID=3346945 RepID=UPI0036621F8F
MRSSRRSDGGLMGNVLSTVWGLITFAGFVVALIIPKTDEHITAYWESAKEGARARARKWSSAVRTAPLVTCVAVALVSVVSALALRGDDRPNGVDIGMLAVAELTQVAFAVAVLYLVTRVPSSMPVVRPTPAPTDADLAALRSVDGPRTALRFINESRTPLRLAWIDHGGNRHDQGVIEPGSAHVRLTYVGHPFVVSSADDGRVVATYAPLRFPGVAAITDPMTEANRPAAQ